MSSSVASLSCRQTLLSFTTPCLATPHSLNNLRTDLISELARHDHNHSERALQSLKKGSRSVEGGYKKLLRTRRLLLRKHIVAHVRHNYQPPANYIQYRNISEHAGCLTGLSAGDTASGYHVGCNPEPFYDDPRPSLVTLLQHRLSSATPQDVREGETR